MNIPILLIILFIFIGCTMKRDIHLLPINKEAQLESLCGGGNDNNGILWTITGNFFYYPGENIIKLQKKYGRWYPSINPKSMVKKGYGVPIPNSDELAEGAMKEYERLIKISRVKEIKISEGIFITREYL